MRQGSGTVVSVVSTAQSVGLRVRGAPALSPAVAPTFVLQEVAIADDARASPAVGLLADLATSASGGPPVVPLLSHGGPSTMAHMSARGVGPEAVVTPFGGRRPTALDEAGWCSIADAFVAAARAMGDRGGLVVIDAGSDTLLGASLSPRYAPSTAEADRPRRLTAIVERVAPFVEVGVLLVVEECAPAGLDAAGGIAAAQAACAAGASFLIADARSAWFEMRGAERSALQHLASASWLPPQVSVPVLAQLPHPAVVEAGLENVRARAKACALNGVVLVGEAT